LNSCQKPNSLIYNKLKALYNDHDIKFVLLTFYNYDIELELKKDTEEREYRHYQQILRKESFERYNNKCVISGIKEELLLEVAHIKPVSECELLQEKSDVNNTLLLWMDIHKYFDKYLISINPKTSKVEVKCEYLMKYNNLEVQLTDKTKEYLIEHYTKYKSLI
jgi:predicted restriction endonuclease